MFFVEKAQFWGSFMSFSKKRSATSEINFSKGNVFYKTTWAKLRNPELTHVYYYPKTGFIASLSISHFLQQHRSVLNAIRQVQHIHPGW